MLAYLLIICVAFFVVAVMLVQLVGEYLFTQRVRDEQRITLELSQHMAESLLLSDAEAMYADAVSLSEGYESRILVLDMHGVVQVDSQSQLNGQRLERREVAEIIDGAESAYGFYVDSQAGNSLFGGDGTTGLYTAAIYSSAGPIGMLAYVSDAQEVYTSMREIQNRIVIWLVVVALCVVVMSLFISRFFTKPIEALNQGILRMTKGDFSSRVNIRGNNEFAQVGRAFNMMSERLESLDRSRNQFVSNASHELKTPLSTIKILIETLIYQDPMDPGMTKEFLGNINREIDRLNGIISDLLSLVSIDSGEMRLKREKFRLDDMVRDCARKLAPLARERGIELEETVRDAVEITADKSKLMQVVYNVIDNAIKYTPRAGSVHVDMARAGKRAVIRISDTGIGIPEEDQKHIFDRFYRVDKARSRETGGTGLGLSIVKQIVMLHNGTISVNSEVGKGSTFTIELPL